MFIGLLLASVSSAGMKAIIGPSIFKMRRYIMTDEKKRSLAVVLMSVLLLTVSPVWASDQETKVVNAMAPK